MEISCVNKKDIYHLPEWRKVLRGKLKELKDGKNTIRVVLSTKENPAGLESAWRYICRRELKKQPHVKTHKHQLGATVWLWMDL